MGGDLCAPYCIDARAAAALAIQSSGGVLFCRSLLHDRTGRHCSDHAFFGPFSWSSERGKQPTASTLISWWLKFGLTEVGWGWGAPPPPLKKLGQIFFGPLALHFGAT